MLAHSRNRRAQQMATRTNKVRTGLFETWSQVEVYASRVDTQVTSLNKDWNSYLFKKWGSDGLAATVTKEKVAEQQSDKTFGDAWRLWRMNWEQFYNDIQEWYYHPISYIRSADKYREVEQYDLELQAWRKKFEARKVNVSMPSPSKPGILGPSNPDVKDSGGIPWTGILVVGGLIGVASILRSLT